MWIHALKKYNTNHILWSADIRAIIGRMTADIRLLSTDGFLIKCHRPTVWRSSADWRPMIGRPSADIMVLMSSKPRPTVGRSLGDHRPKLRRWQNPWKSADRSTKLLTLVLRQKNRRPTKKSSKIGADVARFYEILLIGRRPTISLGNVTAAYQAVCWAQRMTYNSSNVSRIILSSNKALCDFGTWWDKLSELLFLFCLKNRPLLQ